jgi:hypothetical protein
LKSERALGPASVNLALAAVDRLYGAQSFHDPQLPS